MKVLGVDFTSAPGPRKAITVARCELGGSTLKVHKVENLPSFSGFEALLSEKGPWIGGFDFPFGLPREAALALDWPQVWPELVRNCERLGRKGFTVASDKLRKSRPKEKKYPKRYGDDIAKSHSPMKCVRPPVGWMFVEGAPRLLRSGVHIPGIQDGDLTRIAVEAYPGHFARTIVGRASYKSDTRSKQTPERASLRKKIWAQITGPDNHLGISIATTESLVKHIVQDGSGDLLDAVICAMQASWAWNRKDVGYGLPPNMDPLEGWIISS